MVKFTNYQHVEGLVQVNLIRNKCVVGHIVFVDDKDSGFNEMGITIYICGGYIELAESEIVSIDMYIF